MIVSLLNPLGSNFYLISPLPYFKIFGLPIKLHIFYFAPRLWDQDSFPEHLFEILL